MCFCPTIGLKFMVILLLAISATFNFLDSIEDIYNILTFLLVLIAYCLCKLILWIICGNLLGEVNYLVTHLWFQLSMLSTLFSLIGTTLLCMRFHELSEDDV
ncbi:uncharacterized protein [Drosophila bipectinata]|uniref:uncharacterized protein isoform X4 n=1 Tax=Drosophila bipectinata TaxID=42026 RepID=UPI0038B29DF1